MDIYKNFSDLIVSTINDHLNKNYQISLPDSCVCQVPPRKELGDMATNAAMVLARSLRRSPMLIAEELKQVLQADANFDAVNVAGGFINVKFADKLWDEFLESVIASDGAYGSVTQNEPVKVNVEFVSANPTGPLHVGHTRGAILGNALSIILKRAGYDVTKEYYVNDHGNQISNLLESVRFRYDQLAGARLDEELPPNCYPGDYITTFAELLYKQYGKCYVDYDQDQFYKQFKKQTVDYMLDLIRDDLKGLDIKFDVFTSETDLVDSGKVKSAIDTLGDMDLTYIGKLPKPIDAKGSDEDYNAEQLLFRSSAFGDASDRVVVKANGDLTYFASDIAYHYDKFNRGYTHLIDIWGADHAGYVPRMTSALKAISDDQATLNVLLCQMVNLQKNGMPFKMGKRTGTYILVSDVLEAVDPDILKIYMLSRDPESQVTFDLDKLCEESNDSIVYYIQYAFARTNSLLEKYKQTFGQEFDRTQKTVDFYATANDDEKALLTTIARFPSIVKTCAERYVTHLIVNYIGDLAGQFHSYWSTGKKIVDESDKAASDRNLLLIQAIRETIGSGLSCLGVEPKRFLSKK